MNNIPRVTLIDAGVANERLCASAARISTTKGDAMEIFNKPTETQKDSILIGKVLLSGHRSFIEHAKFTFAFSNVSVLAEQFFIEFRLASFTIKSRRYVDFSESGYYLPPGLDRENEDIYSRHVDYLFSEYNEFIKSGVPLEDARFILPYCFCSNFYLSVNARELVHMLKSIKYGRGKNIPELGEIYRQIVSQIEDIFPSLLSEITPERDDAGREVACRFDMIPDCTAAVAGASALLSYTRDADAVLKIAQTLLERGGDVTDGAPGGDSVSFARLSPRVLENTYASFLIRDVSLSAITHFARHRIQSLVIPPFQKVRLDRFVMPDSVLAKPEIKERYENVFDRNLKTVKILREKQFPVELYLCLSGNTLDLITTMNARQYRLFFSLRCCNRAQWEIQRIATEMLNSLRAVQPELYNQMGPSCYPSSVCPEGKLSCGRAQEINERFSCN